MKKLSEIKSPCEVDFRAAGNYILELRDEIKVLRAEVEALKPNAPKCQKCESYNGPTDKLDNDVDLSSYIINRPKI